MNPAKKILVIEDDAKSRYALQSVLEARGFDVTAVSSAEEAHQVNGHPYSAAVIDIRLPKKQGNHFAEELRQEHPNLRIIFVTAYHDTGIQIGIPGSVLLIKPIEMDVLCQLL
jgi:CheY-like chemotaxis protein